MDDIALFKEHLKERTKNCDAILEELLLPGLVISSGTPFTYFADDQDAPFVTTPHFSHWCPEEGPYHLLAYLPGKKPMLLRHAPKDFWYDHSESGEQFWQEGFDIVEYDSKDKLWEQLDRYKGFAFIGPEEAKAKEKGLKPNLKPLVARLDWQRGLKSDYELANIGQASKKAASAHRAARQAFVNGGSEIQIHQAYMQELGCQECDLPYHNIVGLNEKAAVLHYQFKRRDSSGQLLLIDAGARYRGYASDITRTYVHSQVPETFKELLKGMEKLQQELCNLILPGVSYLHLHEQAHMKISDLLIDSGLVSGLNQDDVISAGISKAFFPHGLGHMLGLQVHDVSGLQKNAEGDPCDPSSRFPTLRTARDLRAREVITVEPGLYFIPMLLNLLREQEWSSNLNWKMIDALTPFGGIRIEDNVYIQEGTPKNITREFLGNEFLV
ncbi:MAG: Xaa-Pro dipeptidase [Oligoflexales bacterium]|nr:Xaa-Pro dipeptidase [Oligoflexales bacterium]